ncbi:NAD-dependent epimerase/dehydratase family protein [Halobacteria archaeon HArc-gm2]|nr:NAD-dependent epimerase/dehydratase family protein [Halobacteria archaeon HArc-gm2]
MDVLIIGGTGLISTGITRQLADSEHEVTCFTRGESDARVPDSVAFVHGDRNERGDLADARDEVAPDCVVDMVCFSPDQAEQAVDVFADDVEQFVFCSTVDVYHRPLDTNPVQEDAPREPPVSDYGADKAECEDIFMAAHERGDFETTIVRPWSTYGEGGTLFHTLGQGSYFLDRIREGKPVVVHGDGQTLWGSCHRDDVARAFVNAVGNETAYGEAYHVTSEENITWGQLYRTVADVMDAPDPELVHIPTEILAEAVPDRTDMLLAHFQFSTVFDNSKARRDLGFEYTIPFEDGIRRTIEWLEDEGEIDDWDSENDDQIIAAWRDATDSFLDSVETTE